MEKRSRGGLGSLCRFKRHRESGADLFRAFRGDLRGAEFAHLFYDREAKAVAFFVAAGFIAPVEPLEDVRKVVFAYPAAVILYAQNSFSAVFL